MVQSVNEIEGLAIMDQTIHFLLESVQVALRLFRALATTQLLQLAVNGGTGIWMTVHCM